MKKAIIPLWLSLFFSLLAVALLLLFYFVFLRGSRAPDSIAITESYNSAAASMLVNYLNSPVAVQGEAVTFADLIRLWHNDKGKYNSLLVGSTENALKNTNVEYTDAKGNRMKGSFWVEISETIPPTYNANPPLIEINRQTAWYTSGRASAFVPVSETKALVVTMHYW